MLEWTVMMEHWKRYIEETICTTEYPGDGPAIWCDNGIS